MTKNNLFEFDGSTKGKEETVSAKELRSLEILLPVDGFPAFEEIAHGDLLSLTLSVNTTAFTHGLHRFPAKYIPQIPRWAIQQFASEESIVLDPFMGSGTTIVEGLRYAKHSIGIDVDPLARLIARAKTSQYDIGNLARLSEEIFAARDTDDVECYLPMGGVKNIPHWFNDGAWQGLCKIFTVIDRMKCTPTEKEFFLCVFSSVLRWVSNADDQTQKTYVSGTLIKKPPEVWETFSRALSKAMAGVGSLAEVRNSGTCSVLDSSALEMSLESDTVDLIVTSPPYVDSVDYMYNFMLEYFWLGPILGVSTRQEYNARRRSPIGAKNPTLRANLPLELEGLVDPSTMPLYRRDATIAYFSAMRVHFTEAARVMKFGARYVLVVGNSQAESGVIPVHDCLLRLAKAAGLHLEKAFAYRIRRHYMKFPRKGKGGIILMDWVIILRKTSQAILPHEERLPIPNVTIGDNEVAH